MIFIRLNRMKATIVLLSLILAIGGCRAEEKSTATTVFEKPASGDKPDAFALRHPAAAGFYPADPAQLAQEVKRLLAQSGEPSVGEVMAIITPHAGYSFSGAVAAKAYRYSANRSINTVILIGPCHRMAFGGFSIWPRGVWEMPGFNMQVDEELAAGLVKSGAGAEIAEPHLAEHSLEVQLPFIHQLWPQAKIVPILSGMVTPGETAKLLSDIRELTKNRKDVLLVATCDLSHYHPRAQARSLDDRASELMASFDSDGLRAADQQGEIEIDAPEVVILAQGYATARGANQAKVLMRGDSADFNNDESAVVGYGAFAFEK